MRIVEIRIREISDAQEKERISRSVLLDLPEWFGIPDSTAEYITKSQDKPFIAGFVDDEIAGFIVLNATSEDCAEIFVMGVKKQYHRLGVGSRLCDAYETLAKSMGFSYSQVKTIKMGCYKEYDDTNRFYRSMGYKEFECFPSLWDELNPCQIYIKYIGGTPEAGSYDQGQARH